MAVIYSGVSSKDELVVDGVADALRVTRFDTDDTDLDYATKRSYNLMIPPIRLTAAIALGIAGAGVRIIVFQTSYAARIHIKRIYLQACFDGTAVATSAIWRLYKTRGDSTGGDLFLNTRDTPKKDNNMPVSKAPYLATVRYTVDGTTQPSMPDFDNSAFASLSCQRRSEAHPSLSLVYPSRSPFVLRNNEGFGILADAATVVGDGLGGFIEWDEYYPRGESWQ